MLTNYRLVFSKIVVYLCQEMNAMVAKFEIHNKLIIMMNGENQTHTMPLYMKCF